MSGFNLSEWSLKHRSVAIYLMILAVAAGLFSYYKLGRNEDPAFVIKTMVVQAAWPGGSLKRRLPVQRIAGQLRRTEGPGGGAQAEHGGGGEMDVARLLFAIQAGFEQAATPLRRGLVRAEAAFGRQVQAGLAEELAAGAQAVRLVAAFTLDAQVSGQVRLLGGGQLGDGEV